MWHVKLIENTDPYPTREWIVFRETEEEARGAMQDIFPNGVPGGFSLTFTEIPMDTTVYEV